MFKFVRIHPFLWKNNFKEGEEELPPHIFVLEIFSFQGGVVQALSLLRVYAVSGHGCELLLRLVTSSPSSFIVEL